MGAAHVMGEAAIRAAHEAMWKELRRVMKPAAALPLAALRAGVVVQRTGERVMLVVCGASGDMASLTG